MLTIYTTPPQREKKAQAECRRERIKAYLPLAKVRRRTANRKEITASKPVAPGYVMAERKPYEAQYLRQAIGPISKPEMSSLYSHARTRPSKPAQAFKDGDAVRIKVGTFANVIGKIIRHKGRQTYLVEVQMFGKSHPVALHELHMAKQIDPG